MAIVENLRQKLSGRKILVVGGRGFIGSHAVKSLLTAGARVTTLSHSKTSNPFGRDNLEHLTGDIRDPDSLRRSLSNMEFDYVINAGGYIDHTPYFSGGRDLIDQHFFAV